MKSWNWKDFAEFIGICAVAASLIFVGLQIRQDREIAIAEIFADHDDTQIGWAELIADNSETWVSGLGGDELSDQDRATFNALASAYFSKEWDRYMRSLLISGVPSQGIVANFAHTIHAYPGLEAAWRYEMALGDPFPRTDAYSKWISDVKSEIARIESGDVQHREHESLAPM